MMPTQKIGRGVGDDAEDADPDVGAGVAVAAGQPAEREPDQQGEEERADRQGQGGAAVVADHVDDRAVVGDVGAEVEPGDLAEVLQVLHEQRPVEAERLAPLRRAPPR